MSKNIGCLGLIMKALGILPKEIGNMPYALRDDFLSDSELSFFKVLQQVIGDKAVIYTKVSLQDLFFVKNPNKNMAYYNKIARKHVDFLLCKPDTLKPIAGIELDDKSHQRASRMERDRFVEDVFKTAGLPLIRYENKRSYTLQEVSEKIAAALSSENNVNVQHVSEQENVPYTESPDCPKCGAQMVERTAARGASAGKKFWGCLNYPRCKQIIEI